MSKDALGEKSPVSTQNTISTAAVTSTTSTTDFTNISSYKGNGKFMLCDKKSRTIDDMLQKVCDISHFANWTKIPGNYILKR